MFVSPAASASALIRSACAAPSSMRCDSTRNQAKRSSISMRSATRCGGRVRVRRRRQVFDGAVAIVEHHPRVAAPLVQVAEHVVTDRSGVPRRERERTAEHLLGGAVGAGRLSSAPQRRRDTSPRSRGRPRTSKWSASSSTSPSLSLCCATSASRDAPVIGGSAAMEDALVHDLADDGALEPVLEVFLQIRRRRAAARRPRARRAHPERSPGWSRVAAIRSTVKVLPMTDASCSTSRERIGQGVDAGFDELLDRARDLDGVGVADE